MTRKQADDLAANESADQVAEPDKGARLATIRLRDDVRQQALVGPLGGVLRQLEQEIEGEEPEVASDERHEDEEGGGPDRPAGYVGTPAAPPEVGVVRERAHDGLYEDGSEGAGALQDGESGALAGMADKPQHEGREYLSPHRVPQVADCHPVEAQQRDAGDAQTGRQDRRRRRCRLARDLDGRHDGTIGASAYERDPPPGEESRICAVTGMTMGWGWPMGRRWVGGVAALLLGGALA